MNLLKPEISRRMGNVRLLLASAAIALAGVAHGQTASVSTALLDNAASLENELSRQSACQTRVVLFSGKLATLMRDPVANAAAIEDTKSRLGTNERCVALATERANLMTGRLLQAQQDFAALTKAAPAEVASKVAALRTQHAERASLEFEIRQYEAQIQRLNAEPLANADLIARKTMLLNSVRAELSDVRMLIAAASGEIQNVEYAALAAAADAAAARLSWSIPTTRENGSSLPPSDIGGYEIYMISESTGESSVIVVSDPLAVSYKVEGLAPDTYHFSIAAFDSAGQFSKMSDVVSKTVI